MAKSKRFRAPGVSAVSRWSPGFGGTPKVSRARAVFSRRRFRRRGSKLTIPKQP